MRAGTSLLPGAFVLLACTMTASEARAEGASSGAVGHDIVRLKSGALYRGTISELVPNDHVDIVLVSGDTRRLSFAEIDYAGPESPVAGAPAQHDGPTNPAADAGAHMVFPAEDGEHLTLHEVTGSTSGTLVGYRVAATYQGHSFRELCTAPCIANLSPGEHELALSRGEGIPVIASRVQVPAGPSTLHASYKSHSGLRAGGLALLIAGGALATGLIVYPVVSPSTSCSYSGPLGSTCSKSYDYTPTFVGVGVLLASVIVGAVMIAQHDTARVELVPGVQGAAAVHSLEIRSSEARFVMPAGMTAEGVSLRVRF